MSLLDSVDPTGFLAQRYHVIRDEHSQVEAAESDRPVLIVDEGISSPISVRAKRVLYLTGLGSDKPKPRRAACSGWVDAEIRAYLDRQGIYYAGTEERAASVIAQLERSTTALQTALAAEAIALGRATGVSGALLYSAIAGAAGSSWSFRTTVPRMLGRSQISQEGEQTLCEAIDALSVTLAHARKTSTHLPLTALAKQLYHWTSRSQSINSPSHRVFSALSNAPEHGDTAKGDRTPSEAAATPGAFTVGFIGLGAMGSGMINVLLRAGIDVIGFDAWGPSMRRFESEGGKCALSAADCAANASVLVLMVVNAAQAESLLFGDAGACSTLPKDAIILLMSTVAPSEAKRINSRLAATRSDLHLIDAPVSGGTPRAASGDLTILAAGHETAGPRWGAALSVLKAFSGTRGREDNLVLIPGGPGNGASVKLINQHLAGSHILSVAESLIMAKKLGLPMRLFREIMLTGPAWSWMMGHRGQNMLDGLIKPPTSMIDIFVKDMGIVVAEAAIYGVPVPLASLAEQQFIAGKSRGWGSDDDSSIIRLWDERGLQPMDG